MKSIAVVLSLILAVVYALPSSNENDRCQVEKNGTRFPDIYNCQKYTECSSGKELNKTCKNGEYFDVESLKCTVKSPASSNENNRCQVEKNGTRFPEMCNCHKYTECSSGKELNKTCKSDKHFDVESLKCTDFSTASCFYAPTTATTTTEKVTTTQKATTTTTTKHTTTKKPTTTTTTQKATITQKPTTTTTRKPRTTTTKHTTTTPTTTTTEEPTTAAPVPTCNTSYELNCSMYWSCETGQPMLKPCLDGYFFYEPLRSCLPGDLETCKLFHA